jgi:hypothetical protein
MGKNEEVGKIETTKKSLLPEECVANVSGKIINN